MSWIHPSNVEGTVPAPSSKSAAQRAILAAALAHGTSRLRNLTRCADVRAALGLVEALGATEDSHDDASISVTGQLSLHASAFNAGESGTSFRLFAPILCLFKETVTLHAEGSLCKRPMNMVQESLAPFGAHVQTTNGLAPLTLRGPLCAGHATVDAFESSQVLSGLLFALPLLSQASYVFAPDSVSKPYLAMTLETLDGFGVRVDADKDFTEFRIPGGQTYLPADLVLEGDYSGAAFPLVAAALTGDVTMSGLRWPSAQADANIITILQDYGADVQRTQTGFRVRRGARKPIRFDATHCPDLVPPLVALAAHAQGTSEVLGASRLVHKESNRARALQEEYGKLGILIEIDQDRLLVHGGSLHGGEVESHGDHRIAMSLAVAALAGTAPVFVHGASCIDKSYPEFFADLQRLKGNVS